MIMFSGFVAAIVALVLVALVSKDISYQDRDDRDKRYDK
jgi:hypothetical protein